MSDTVALLLWGGSFWLVSTWSLLAVRRYQLMYERVHGDSPKFSEYYRGTRGTDPERMFSDAPHVTAASWKILLEHQQNPELERARRTGLRRMILLLAFVLATPVIVIGLSNIVR
jgi:hypothetical protein